MFDLPPTSRVAANANDPNDSLAERHSACHNLNPRSTRIGSNRWHEAQLIRAIPDPESRSGIGMQVLLRGRVTFLGPYFSS